MTNGHLLFLGLLISTTILCGQTFNEKYFIKTDWFSNNKDSVFFRADTLKLIKYSNFGTILTPKKYAESEIKYLNHGDYVTLSFKKYKKIDFSWRYDNYIGLVSGGQWTRTFDKKTNELKIYNDKKELIASFKPISEKKIKIESIFLEQKNLLTTIELTLLRKK